jgi:signal transduction histidine kinase
MPHAYPAYPAGPARAARPPLIKRISKRRWVALDYAVAAFAVLCDLVIMRQGLVDMGHAWFPAALVLAAAVSAPMALRRRAPIPAFGALIILALLLSSMTPTVTAIIFLATAYVLYTVTVSSSRRTGGAALGLVLITMVIAASVSHGLDGAVEGAFVPVAFANIIAWMTGYSVRQRRLYVVHLQHQAASSAVAEERLRIARELHDVVAHSMSVIAVQAGYGQYVIDTSPDGARDALGAIQATSRDALEEMRRMLGVLRQQDIAPIPPDADSLGTADTADPMATAADPGATRSGAAGAEAARHHAGTGAGAGRAGRAPLAPAPGLADLDRLIKRTGGAGVRVGLHVSGQVRPVPAGIDLSAYRIIQEALTNVVKHSGSARCTVSLGYGSGVLDVRVINEGGLVSGRAGVRAAPSTPVIGAGHGIIGMRERVNLCGGTFKAGSRADGGFLVAATLPLPLPTADDGVFPTSAIKTSAIEGSAIKTSAIEGSAIKTSAIKTSAVEGSVTGHSGGQE